MRVIESTSQVKVCWDLDGKEVIKNLYVDLEDALTPLQIDLSMVQEGSGSAATTHSRIEEDFVEPAGDYYRHSG